MVRERMKSEIIFNISSLVRGSDTSWYTQVILIQTTLIYLSLYNLPTIRYRQDYHRITDRHSARERLLQRDHGEHNGDVPSAVYHLLDPSHKTKQGDDEATSTKADRSFRDYRCRCGYGWSLQHPQCRYEAHFLVFPILKDKSLVTICNWKIQLFSLLLVINLWYSKAIHKLQMEKAIHKWQMEKGLLQSYPQVTNGERPYSKAIHKWQMEKGLTPKLSTSDKWRKGLTPKLSTGDKWRKGLTPKLSTSDKWRKALLQSYPQVTNGERPYSKAIHKWQMEKGLTPKLSTSDKWRKALLQSYPQVTNGERQKGLTPKLSTSDKWRKALLQSYPQVTNGESLTPKLSTSDKWRKALLQAIHKWQMEKGLTPKLSTSDKWRKALLQSYPQVTNGEKALLQSYPQVTNGERALPQSYPQVTNGERALLQSYPQVTNGERPYSKAIHKWQMEKGLTQNESISRN